MGESTILNNALLHYKQGFCKSMEILDQIDFGAICDFLRGNGYLKTQRSHLALTK